MGKFKYLSLCVITIVVILFLTSLVGVNAKNGLVEPIGEEPILDEFVYLPIIIRPEINIQIIYIAFDPSIDPQLDELDESVVIENKDTISEDMTGWVLRDDVNNHEFVFPAFTLDSGARVVVWTKSGIDIDNDLFWNLDNPIWNDDGGTATLKNTNGDVIHTCNYSKYWLSGCVPPHLVLAIK